MDKPNIISAIATLDRWHKELQYDLARATQARAEARALKDNEELKLSLHPLDLRLQSAARDTRAAWRYSESRVTLLTERSEALAFALDTLTKQKE